MDVQLCGNGDDIFCIFFFKFRESNRQ